MATWRRLFGNRGEEAAAAYLQKQGLEILARQYGARGGEIDLVAKEGEEIVFVEVKSRNDESFGYPEEAVTPEKVRKIVRAACQYLHENKLEAKPWRVDVVAIAWCRGREREIHHVRSIDMPEGF